LPVQAHAFRALIGRSEPIQEAVAMAFRVARSPIRIVLLDGETGTGKELFARGIHAASARAAEPFITINCAAIPAALLESELFGHERGAFTDATSRKAGLLELAKGGTVLLDEVAELSLALQAKLLRVLEDRVARRVGGLEEIAINARVVAATNVPLESAVLRGAFREDLYYRLNAFRITLPPLRERDGDLELLARHFLHEIAIDQPGAPVTISREAIDLLQKHEWRGNVRELKHVIERAVVTCEGPEILPRHVTLNRRSSVVATSKQHDAAGQITIPRAGMSMDEIECEAIRITMAAANGNQSKAARMLNISRATLLRKLDKYRLGEEAGPRDASFVA